MISRSWYAAAAWLWTLAIFVGTWLPGKHMPHSELERSWFFKILPLDKVAHLGLFAGFAFLWFLARRTPELPMKRVLGLGFLVAVVTEIGQSMPWVNRDTEIYDVFADTLGLFLGLGCFLLLKVLVSRVRTV